VIGILEILMQWIQDHKIVITPLKSASVLLFLANMKLLVLGFLFFIAVSARSELEKCMEFMANVKFWTKSRLQGRDIPNRQDFSVSITVRDYRGFLNKLVFRESAELLAFAPHL
jgi:hypothetical protein